MTPQPMDEDDIIKCIVQAGCLGTVKMTFESGPYDITRTSINADKLARAILAARDAQWLAMLGEPVAGRSRFHGMDAWAHCSADHARMVNSAPNEWPGYEAQPLYAIKDTP